MNLLRLAAQLTRRDLRSGEVRVLVLALAVAVAAVSGVGFLTSRVDAAMQRQAAELLAADVAIESPNALPADWDGQAERDDLLSARLVNFPSVVFQDGRSQLVQVKAVTEAYPLRGVLRYANEVEGQERVADAAPAAGEVWVDGCGARAEVDGQPEVAERFEEQQPGGFGGRPREDLVGDSHGPILSAGGAGPGPGLRSPEAPAT